MGVWLRVVAIYPSGAAPCVEVTSTRPPHPRRLDATRPPRITRPNTTGSIRSDHLDCLVDQAVQLRRLGRRAPRQHHRRHRHHQPCRCQKPDHAGSNSNLTVDLCDFVGTHRLINICQITACARQDPPLFFHCFGAPVGNLKKKLTLRLLLSSNTKYRWGNRTSTASESRSKTKQTGHCHISSSLTIRRRVRGTLSLSLSPILLQR